MRAAQPRLFDAMSGGGGVWQNECKNGCLTRGARDGPRSRTSNRTPAARLSMADVPIDLTDNTDEVINLTSPRKSLAQEEDERLSAAAAILLASVPPDTLKPGKARRLCRKQLGDPSPTPAAVAARARATVDESPGAGDEPGLECGCCFCETPLPELVQCSEGHVFCRDCLAAYAREQVFGGGRARLACMCADGPPCRAVPNSNLQHVFNVSILDSFDATSSAVLRKLAESNRSVQKSAESTSI